jgi:hypothetical protein
LVLSAVAREKLARLGGTKAVRGEGFLWWWLGSLVWLKLRCVGKAANRRLTTAQAIPHDQIVDGWAKWKMTLIDAVRIEKIQYP